MLEAILFFPWFLLVTLQARVESSPTIKNGSNWWDGMDPMRWRHLRDNHSIAPVASGEKNCTWHVVCSERKVIWCELQARQLISLMLSRSLAMGQKMSKGLAGFSRIKSPQWSIVNLVWFICFASKKDYEGKAGEKRSTLISTRTEEVIVSIKRTMPNDANNYLVLFKVTFLLLALLKSCLGVMFYVWGVS